MCVTVATFTIAAIATVLSGATSATVPCAYVSGPVGNLQVSHDSVDDLGEYRGLKTAKSIPVTGDEADTWCDY